MARLCLMLPRLSRYGGAERFGFGLAEALAREGHQVDFLCARREDDPPPGVRAVELGRFGLTRFGKLAWFLYACEKARRAGDYDLSISLGKTWNQDLLRLGGGPLSVFWRLSGRAWPEGPARLFKALRRRLSPVNLLIKAVEDRQARSGCRIAAVSHKVADWLREDRPELDPARIAVIYNRPDLSRFAPAPAGERARLRAALGLADSDVLVVTAATNFALKGVDPLIRALAELPENFRLRVAGGRGAGRYLRLARRLGVAGRTDFAGRVEDMAAFYAAADVFALPTFYDACSNAVLEALACGLAVVASNDNGSSFFLPPERVLPDPADHRDLAARILAASREPRPGPFAWPEDAPCGLPPYLELVRTLLRERGRI